MKTFLTILGSLFFIISVIAHIYVKIKLRPKQDSDFDDIYWEFEDTYPSFARYNRLSRITFSGIVIGTLLLFLALVF
ncbi:MAG: hypothetical protein KJ757_06200 [Planctomycetes bacterium]|nr:hypothetical protein [Planctomycetota bacterium]MBU1518059.1 hypothetical protein [Planctomycetota bacterium]MBU2458498.1 hypothetical protein [Planctomycetota bacterium]MBU2597129.1 hypothetical protein [Planctomycetota bacterium]